MGESSGAAELFLDFRLRLSTVTNQSIIASDRSACFLILAKPVLSLFDNNGLLSP